MLQDPAYASSACVVMQMKSDNIRFICLITLYDISDGSVTGLAATWCEAALTESDEYHIYEIFPVAIPHIKHANSLAIAVVATFRLTPLLSVIL